MPAKIILISANRCIHPYPVYPLGLSHVAAALERAGHTVTFLDVNIDNNDCITETIRSVGPDLVGLSLRNIDDVAIDTQRFFVPDLLTATTLVKEATSAPVVIGGSAYSLFPAELLTRSKAEFGIVGEGEQSMAALADAIVSKTDPTSLPGLVYQQADKVIFNPRGAMNMDTIPCPVRPFRLTEYYLKNSSMLNVQTQRGCGYTCCYCTYPLIEGSRCRMRRAADVADELEAGRRAGGHYFFIVDSVFNTSPGHVAAICEEIIKRKLAIAWGCFLRPKAIPGDLMALMVRAGLTHIEFGSDSFCSRVLEAYGKNITFEDILEASNTALRNNVRYAHFLIPGGPGETEETLREGFENSKKLTRTVIFPFIGMRIYPGTPLYTTALAEGVVTREQSLLSPSFYISPLVSRQRISELLAEFNSQSQNWITGEPEPAMQQVVNKLRSRGVEGPLWEFLIR